MRDRLIELLDRKIEYAIAANEPDDEFLSVETDELANYLLANGVIVPPCKVGDKVFFINKICDENADEHLDILDGVVVSLSIQNEGLWIYCLYENGLTYWHLVADVFGKTVFLTKEEAEAKLKGGEG